MAFLSDSNFTSGAEASALIKALLNKQAIAVFAVALGSNQLISWSPNLEKMLGENISSLISDFNFILRKIDPHDRFHALETIEQAAGLRSNLKLSYRWQKNENEILSLFATAVPSFVADIPVLEGMIIDMSESTSDLLRLDRIGGFMDQQICILDTELKVIYSSPNFEFNCGGFEWINAKDSILDGFTETEPRHLLADLLQRSAQLPNQWIKSRISKKCKLELKSVFAGDLCLGFTIVINNKSNSAINEPLNLDSIAHQVDAALNFSNTADLNSLNKTLVQLKESIKTLQASKDNGISCITTIEAALLNASENITYRPYHGKKSLVDQSQADVLRQYLEFLRNTGKKIKIVSRDLTIQDSTEISGEIIIEIRSENIKDINPTEDLTSNFNQCNAKIYLKSKSIVISFQYSREKYLNKQDLDLLIFGEISELVALPNQLKAYGVNSSFTADSSEVMLTLEKNLAKALLCDSANNLAINMITKARSLSPQTWIIACSTGERDDVMRLKRAGADLVLRKPVSISKLLNALKGFMLGVSEI